MIINIYLNEQSLCGYNDINDFISAFANLKTVIHSISGYSKATRILYSKHIYHTCPTGEHIGSIIKKRPDFNHLFNDFFQRNASVWNNEQVHNSIISYEYNGNNYSSTTVAEATEHTIVKNIIDDVVLINIDDKIFSSPNVQVIKNKNSSIDLKSIHSTDSLLNFLKNIGVIVNIYDYNCNYPPKDFQTILYDSSQFEKTTYINKRRKVYKRINHDEYWCVDNQHTKDAHLEVFDSTTFKHKGKSPIDKALLQSGTSIPKRYMEH